MIYLFHGDDQANSRAQAILVRQAQSDVRVVSGDKLAPRDLESILGTESLFGAEALWIENLFSRVRSKDKEACVALLSAYTGSRTIILWEKKAITKAATAKLPKSWKIKESKPPAVLFTFLDSLYPGNYQEAKKLLGELRKTSEEGFIFIMLSRHISTLIQASSATTLKLPPWQIGKLKGQAQKWHETQLTMFYDRMYQIDLHIKTGATKLDQASQLDILLRQVLG
jgi:DNA polymerase III delta subunit